MGRVWRSIRFEAFDLRGWYRGRSGIWGVGIGTWQVCRRNWDWRQGSVWCWEHCRRRREEWRSRRCCCGCALENTKSRSHRRCPSCRLRLFSAEEGCLVRCVLVVWAWDLSVVEEYERKLFESLTVVGGFRLRSRYRCGYPLLFLLVSSCRIPSPRYSHPHHLAALVTLSFSSSSPSVAAFPHLDPVRLCSGPGSCSSHVDFWIYWS